MMNVCDPDASLFRPAVDRGRSDPVTRPSRSYWRNAWLRLERNRRALGSLWILGFMTIFTLVGPVAWRVDPAAQDLTQVSLGPTLGRRALLVENDPPAAAARPSAGAFEAVGTPTTEAIVLEWQPIAGARGYRLYRHEYPPSGPLDLGLPLGSLSASQRFYIDGFRLRAIDYYYTLVADPSVGSRPDVLHVKLTAQQAITIQQAQRLALIGPHDLAGEFIRLPAHPLGTDYLGRDMLARLMRGARTSLFIGVAAPLICMLIGVLYGGAAGYLGGRIDREMMRIGDFVLALPFLLFMILFKVMFGPGPGESGVAPMLVALILLSWPATARLVRGQVLQSRNFAYIDAARLMGAGPGYIIVRHLLPNLLSVVLVSLTFAIPTAIFIEAFLSFIGMGVVPPTPSWGSMCNDGLRSLISHPHELGFPALFISVTVLAFNLLGDGLRDCLDVRLGSGP
jgi:oligopeptide transport system permease protein